MYNLYDDTDIVHTEINNRTFFTHDRYSFIIDIHVINSLRAQSSSAVV